MYEDLVKRLRELPHLLFVQLHGHEDVVYQAADAIEAVSRHAAEWEFLADSWQKACKRLESRMPRWIPVTERLPEEFVVVLCYCSRNDQYGCGEWVKEDNGTIYWSGLNGMIPTHWMPLPQPPEEES